MLLRTCRFLWSPYHRPSLYWLTLKLIKGKIHYFVKKGKTLVKIFPCPSVTKVVMVTKIRYGTEGLSSGAGISLKAASGKEQEMASRNTYDLSDLWYYQTVTCIALSANRKWWLGAIFGVSVNLGPCYLSVIFPSFCHCFFSVWECLIIHAADNWSLTLYIQKNKLTCTCYIELKKPKTYPINLCLRKGKQIWYPGP